MKKLLSIFSITALIIGINACGSDKNNKVSEQLEEQTIDQINPETADFSALEDKIAEAINAVSTDNKNVDVTSPEFIEKAKAQYPDIQMDIETLQSVVYKGKYTLKKLSLENFNLTQEMIEEAASEN